MPRPSFDIHDQAFPLYTHGRFLPSTRVSNCEMNNVLINEGCLITEASINHSVIGIRSIIKSGARIKDTVIMGADYYDYSSEIPIGIGKNSDIEGAIIDKNVRMGQDVFIRPFPHDTDFDTDAYSVKEGIVVVPKNTILPSGTRIGPEE